MPKYNHAYTIAFSLETDHEAEKVPAFELYRALLRRTLNLMDNPGEIHEAVGLPFDTYEVN